MHATRTPSHLNTQSHTCPKDVNLDGPVPHQFCALEYLREFDVDGAQLSGPFPR